MNQTSRIIRPLLEFLFPTAPAETILLYHGVIRKLAHVTEYAVLGVLACRAFRTIFDSRLYALLASFALVFLIASLDEFNQSFNSLRTGSPWDVAIDIIGGAVSIFMYFLLARRNRGAQF